MHTKLSLSFRWTLAAAVVMWGGCDARDIVADGGNGAPVALPSCLRELFAACPTGGMCTKTANLGGSQHYCFAGGVSADTASSGGGCDGTGQIVLQVRKADGSLCYSAELRPGLICEGESLTWSDAAGNLVATGRWDGTTTVQCATGETGPCTDGQCTLGSIFPVDSCQTGSCP